MSSVFPTIIAVLIGLSFAEYYGETAMPEGSLWGMLLTLPACFLPALVAEIILFVARTRFDAGRPLDFRRYANLIAQMPLPVYALVLFFFDWPKILVPLGLERTVLVDHVVVLLPYLILYAVSLIETLRMRRPFTLTDEGARPATISDVSAAAWEMARQLGLVLVPILGLMLALDLVRDTPLRLYFGHLPLLSTLFLIVIFVVLAMVYPILFRYGLKLRPLIEGAPLRTHLERQADRLGFQCRDILMWSTKRPVLNAAIVGFIPRYRYVIFTTELCRRLTLDELGAVFTHEVGHGKRHHAFFYLLFSLTFLTLLVPLGAVVGRSIEVSTHGEVDASLAGAIAVYLPAFVLYWRFVFGYLSRRFELEADVYGVEAGKEPRLFIDTLEKVGRLARIKRGARAMRHFSIAGRTDFLRRAFLDGDQPLLAALKRRLHLMRRGIIVSATAVLLIGSAWLALESMRGAGVIFLELDRPERARTALAGVVALRPTDAVALELLAEADLYRDPMPAVDRGDYWARLSPLLPRLLNEERTAVLESLWVGWARATAVGRHDVASILVRRAALVNVVDRGEGPRPFDEELDRVIDEMEAMTAALAGGDVDHVRTTLADLPRWLRRPDLRRARAYIEEWVTEPRST